MIKSIAHAEHYIWDDNCEGWHLVKTPVLSIIQERMQANTYEKQHYHELAQQFIYFGGYGYFYSKRSRHCGFGATGAAYSSGAGSPNFKSDRCRLTLYRFIATYQPGRSHRNKLKL